MIKAGIIGGAGYTAGELIRLLINHPGVEIAFIKSKSHAGQLVTHVHTDLIGETTMVFEDEVDLSSADVIFLCMGHGKSVEFIQNQQLSSTTMIIDLSTDFRMYSPTHDFVYGLPELNKTAIKQATHIANPGCFATAIQLALLPIAVKQQLPEIHIHGITGSTGAGQSPTASTHFSWRSSNVSAYKSFTHQHLHEIKQTLTSLQPGFDAPINFVPLRGDFTRGIFASLYFDCPLNQREVVELYSQYYQSHPFVVITAENPDLKMVVNTNKAVLHLQKHGSKLHIISLIDNLIKGASGQAVQNMNLMFGFDEQTGLRLKPVAF
jgi:N-acetyl-gamma-glutamyl-phosphate reductase